MNPKIDFVITWVDGNDEEWQKEKSKYISTPNFDSNKVRYRDWNIIKYLFRSIEKNAPWVNKVYLITWGHIPEWLNINNEKLVIVKHSDYIPEKYLPTFNSCTIELNMEKIKELSENFVYFNDDCILSNKVKPEDFFKKDLPCASAALNVIIPYGKSNFEHRLVNNSNVINRNFNLIKSIKKNPFKWFNFKYKSDNIRTLLLLPWKKVSTLKEYHTCISLKKSIFTELWNTESDVMDISCKDKFRSFFGVNPWVVEEWQIMSGKFIPRSNTFGKMFIIEDDNKKIEKYMNKYKCICLNDNDKIQDFEKTKENLIKILEKRFSEKSSFEK